MHILFYINSIEDESSQTIWLLLVENRNAFHNDIRNGMAVDGDGRESRVLSTESWYAEHSSAWHYRDNDTHTL